MRAGAPPKLGQSGQFFQEKPNQNVSINSAAGWGLRVLGSHSLEGLL